MRPRRKRLLDTYSGAGGAGYGYGLAGFEVTGVDNRPQPRYPFRFIQADALDVLADREFLAQFDAIHGSPPCPARSRATPDRSIHPRLIGATRTLLQASGLPWVMENVPPAPGAEYLRPDLIVCACQTDLDRRLVRERWFETSWQAFDLRPPCHHEGLPAVSVLRHGARYEINRRQAGGHHRHVPHTEAEQIMGIGWMTQTELGDAIPPAYTEYVGGLLMEYLETQAAPAAQ